MPGITICVQTLVEYIWSCSGLTSALGANFGESLTTWWYIGGNFRGRFVLQVEINSWKVLLPDPVWNSGIWYRVATVALKFIVKKKDLRDLVPEKLTYGVTSSDQVVRGNLSGRVPSANVCTSLWRNQSATRSAEGDRWSWTQAIALLSLCPGIKGWNASVHSSQ